MNTIQAVDWDEVALRLQKLRETASTFASQAHAHFGTRLRDARLFGSAARGDWQEGSDVDVLILLDQVHPEDRTWIADHATRLGILGSGVLLSTVTMCATEFDHLRQRERLFAQEVDREGVPLL